MKLQSRISTPTLTAMPANTAKGIISINDAAPNTATINTTTRTNPDNAVRPPDWILTTVPIVAPAPGKPPNKPDMILPKP